MTMPHWNLHRPRREPGEAAAHQVRRAVRWLNDRTRAYAGRAPITTDMLADLAVMARHGDLAQIAIDGSQNGTTVATWLVRVTEVGFHSQDPAVKPADAVLRGLRYRVVPTRMSREHLYRHLLRCSWTAPVSRR
jgi:hypothetical protein